MPGIPVTSPLVLVRCFSASPFVLAKGSTLEPQALTTGDYTRSTKPHHQEMTRHLQASAVGQNVRLGTHQFGRFSKQGQTTWSVIAKQLLGRQEKDGLPPILNVGWSP